MIIDSLYRRKIGLALGGGGVKGLAHIGVLKVLDRNKVKIDCIAGTSIGAVIGAMYASGMSGADIEKWVLESSNWKAGMQILDPILKNGIFKINKIEKIIARALNGVTFKSLTTPLTVVATNLDDGQEVDINKGDLLTAIRASICVPPVFTPVKVGNKLLADGGLCNPVPDDVVRRMGADKVIAVNLEAAYFRNHFGLKNLSIPKVSMRSLNILRYHLAKYCLKSSDVVIEPVVKDTGLIGLQKFFKPEKVKEFIKAGEKATELAIGKIKEL